MNMKIPANLKFDEKGLIPAVIQDWRSSEVLMVAYMNAESVRKTVETGLTWFWSRSRQKFWQKGETSGHVQLVKGQGSGSLDMLLRVVFLTPDVQYD